MHPIHGIATGHLVWALTKGIFEGEFKERGAYIRAM